MAGNIPFILLILFPFVGFGQEVITVDTTGVVKEKVVMDSLPKQTEVVADSVVPFKRFKAEGVSAVVGEYVVLDTDIDKAYLEFEQRGVSTEGITRCNLLGKLMEDKLYVHQAKIDSLTVSDAEINAEVDQVLQVMVGELGSEDKVLKLYKKNTWPELRSEVFQARKELKLAGLMQQKVVENVEVTPEEVRNFFYSIPEDDRPVFSAEVEVAQIIIEPEVTEDAREDVIDRLNEMRIDVVENGASFTSKAVFYSEDKGSAQRGGLIPGVTRNGQYAKEFKDMAFSLQEGEVSEPFETQFGWHILKVDKIRGQEVDVRHILLFPEVKEETIERAKEEIDSVRQKITDGRLTFAEAAREYSDEEETRNNGGQLVNPVSFDTRFDLTKMDPTLSAQVYNLEEGELTPVLRDRDFTGKSYYKIMTVTKRYDEHPADFVKDYEKIKDLALKEKKIREIEKWQNKKIDETYVSVNNDYQECDFSSNWLKNNQQ